jgi:hypothetical protein
MTMLNDIVRCEGVSYDGEWRDGCETCLRRNLPVNGERVVMMEPPAFIVFFCPYLIEPEE